MRALRNAGSERRTGAPANPLLLFEPRAVPGSNGPLSLLELSHLGFLQSFQMIERSLRDQTILAQFLFPRPACRTLLGVGRLRDPLRRMRLVLGIGLRIGIGRRRGVVRVCTTNA